MQGLCDYCQEEKAVTTCDVCGAKVCQKHTRDYGCDVCNGGEKTFS